MTSTTAITDALKPCPFCGPKPELSGEWPLAVLFLLFLRITGKDAA